MSTPYLNPGSRFRERSDAAAWQVRALAAKRLVREEDIDALTQLHRDGKDLTYVLELSAALGKHSVSQHLLMMGVPVTRQALSGAASRHGPGVDLLLAGIHPEDKQQACSFAMSLRMLEGDFDKSYAMLDAGVKPDQRFLSYAYTGTLNHANPSDAAFQDALDRYLAVVDREVLASSHLDLFVAAGRPVHIERALEKLQQPLTIFMASALGSPSVESMGRLRALGCRIDDAAFSLIANSLDKQYVIRLAEIMARQLCEMVVADGTAGTISAASVEPFFRFFLNQKVGLIRSGVAPGPNYLKVADVITHLATCMKPQERDQLHAILDRWQNSKTEALDQLEPHVLAQVHSMIDAYTYVHDCESSAVPSP